MRRLNPLSLTLVKDWGNHPSRLIPLLKTTTTQKTGSNPKPHPLVLGHLYEEGT